MVLSPEEESIFWYHTIELEPGVVTPGWFDLRPIVDLLPWPDVQGKRCLDIGTYDGFLAFELERRGASEVVAVDISDHTQWDWPARMRATAASDLALIAGPTRGDGFRVASSALGSQVQLVACSIYDLPSSGLGEFDVVTCGSLLLHLRDPIRALESVRMVCAGEFMSSEAIDLWLTLLHRRRPYARIDGVTQLCQWWTPNPAAHAGMLTSAGFDIIRSTKPYAVPMGVRHPPAVSLRQKALEAVQRITLGNAGVPHVAVLARPAC